MPDVNARLVERLIRAGVPTLVLVSTAVLLAWFAEGPNTATRRAALVGLVVLAAASAAMSVREYRLRRRVERRLQGQRLFDSRFAEVSTTFVRRPTSEMDSTMRGAIERVLDLSGADRVLIFDTSDPADSRWRARFEGSRDNTQVAPLAWDVRRSDVAFSRLLAGQIVTFVNGENLDELTISVPPDTLPEAAVAVPLMVGASLVGVLWCLWLDFAPKELMHPTVQERFRLFAELFASAMRRSQVEAGLDESRDLNAAILDSIHLHVAVLDRAGTIIAVNRAWMEFGRTQAAPPSAIGPGASYLAAAEKGADAGAPGAAEALTGICAVCEGRRESFTLEYECSSGEAQRWFMMTVAALRREGEGAVVTHKDITESKIIEANIRESESRFRLLADALPVSVWMSDGSGHRTYFNRAWLEFTGGDAGWQLGDGWTDRLHPDDRQRYLAAYRSAHEAREPYSIEYRVRAHDGRYGWFIDRAVPRYTSDGAFHGFVGGSVDVTERKENELALRDLAGRVITAEEEDRRRIARDLHDDVNQLVALLAIEIEQIHLTGVQNRAELAERTRALSMRVSEIAAEVHRVSHALHPARLETFGLVPAIDGLCAEITRQQQLRVRFFTKGVPHPLPPDIALCLFRIAQEALRNAIRHSGAKEATVELRGAPGRIMLRVSDKGRGFDSTERHAGLGLVSMRERVRYAGGELAIDSRQGKGTRITIELPLAVTKEATCAPTLA